MPGLRRSQMLAWRHANHFPRTGNQLKLTVPGPDSGSASQWLPRIQTCQIKRPQ